MGLAPAARPCVSMVRGNTSEAAGAKGSPLPPCSLPCPMASRNPVAPRLRVPRQPFGLGARHVFLAGPARARRSVRRIGFAP